MALRKLFAAAVLSVPLAGLAQTPEAKPAEAPPAAPAAAPAPLVQVYGTLNVNLQYTEASGATTPSENVKPRFAIATDSTGIGVRGTLDLGHGYKGVYQCETTANLDGEDTRAICNRNSRVGLQSFWGTLFYGNWDTPYKSGHYGTKADDVFGNTDVFGYQGIMGSPGYGTRTGAFNSSATNAVTASFDQRGANSVAYWTPKFGGLSGKIQYSVDEFSNQTGVVRPQLLAAAVNYDMGPFSVVAAAEYHEDAFGIRSINAANNQSMTSKDLGLRLAAGYDLPLGVGTLNVVGMVEQLSYAQDDSPVGYKDFSRIAWMLGAKFRTGPHELRARYSMALAPDISGADGAPALPATADDDLGATSYAVGYAYHFAKSTQVYVFYTQIMNEDQARYTFGVGGAAAVVGANTQEGSTPTAGGAGIRLAF
ncbi:MAG TPA: porin [Anaeromyxobacter sp.]|nr:porin [Anaeromyxobacter sp.]